MKILVINCGSSSVKFQLFDMQKEEAICKGIVEKIGTNMAIIKIKALNQPESKETGEVLDHRAAIAKILNAITDKKFNVLTSVSEITAVGHRVVHGGEYFTGSRLITSEVMAALEQCIQLAPLHNPPNIRGILACQELLPDIPQAGVFDTAFHQTMPSTAFLYGLPNVMYEKYKIRRYGFHGTSHQYAAKEAALMVGKPLESLRIITCHLGNGASITAIKEGRSIDTSMGFTPLEGLIMGTRCGDLDPAIIPYLIEKDKLTLDGINNLMNKHSGVYGLAGLGTGDMRDLELAAESGNKKAEQARQIYAYRVKKYIGSYMAVLGGLDILVFTGGVGENDWHARELILAGMEEFGLSLDIELNRKKDQKEISKGKVHIFVIKANEELVIAREAKNLIFQKN